MTSTLSSPIPPSFTKEKIAIEQWLTTIDVPLREHLAEQQAHCPDFYAYLLKACIGSAYLYDALKKHPQYLLLPELYAIKALDDAAIHQKIAHACQDGDSDEALAHALRQVRRELMVIIIWRDLNGLSSVLQTAQAMTALAQGCIEQALNTHYRGLCKQYGTPRNDDGQPQPMLVLGMGKLGGGELNVSSDIDLIFTYPEAGMTDHPRRPLDNQTFFCRLGQRLIKTLDENRPEGFVFRVDMRLRPYGQSGALVSSFAALENYYQTQGRDWERFAAIKARVVACCHLQEQHLRQVTKSLYQILRPFVYRQYTDFSVIESLRQLKATIVQEVRRQGMEDNIKLGAGGIRECEFIVQAFQLVSGGRHRHLQQRHWLDALEQLQTHQLLDAQVAAQLRNAYLFLRRLEHVLQAYADEQTQQLPASPGRQAVLAWVMGYANWQMLQQTLSKHRQVVSEQFQKVIAEPEKPKETVAFTQQYLALWHAEQIDVQLSPVLHGLGKKGGEVCKRLHTLRESGQIGRLSASARTTLDALVPALLHISLTQDPSTVATLRLLQWLEKIASRRSYLTLLLENPAALERLSLLFKESIWVATTLTQMPALLDELLGTVTLYNLPDKAQLQDELRLSLLRIDTGDVEAMMEALRYFKLSHSLRVAASELAGHLPLMKVSDYLSWIAEVILAQVLQIAWQQLVTRHGFIADLEAQVGSGFAVIAYGKLGGIELSYGSDLDLVFVYQGRQQGQTNGDKPLDLNTFYTRLGQKIIHLLTARTFSGSLYDVDMRLRPSGNSGLLVTSLAAFSRYQQQDAWVWEHQALVRARPIAGDMALQQAVRQLRLEVLQQPREQQALQQAVVDMRNKMREHLACDQQSPPSGSLRAFDIKQDAGGIVDIEFMVQYAVLAWSSEQPALCRFTDNIRILEYLRSQPLFAEQADRLIEIYQYYRGIVHRLALQEKPSLLNPQQQQTMTDDDWLNKQQTIKQLWQRLFAPAKHH